MALQNDINSYDTGTIPYKHDEKRSYWHSTKDFTLTCIGHCFGLRNFYVLSAYLKLEGKIIVLIPYIITIFLFIIPVFFVQASIGQFSSTGYISVFRVSPLFKGVGYVILLLNFSSVTYYSAMAAYPLLFFFKSFTLEIPWMTCNNSWNTGNCTEAHNHNHTFNQIGQFLLVSPAKEYFQKEVIKILNPNDPFEISWPIVGASFLIWFLVGLCIVNGIATLGRILRYTTITTLIILVILFIRFSFLPNALRHFLNFITPSLHALRSPDIWLISPILGALTLGSGWGTVMTLASYNRFKVNVEKCSIWIPTAMSFIILLSGLMVYFINEYMRERNIFNIYIYSEYSFEFLCIGIPYFVGTIEFSQLWSILIYLMLFFCEINSVIIQTLSIVTALFDEYVILRSFKQYFIAGVCSVLFLLSTFFATNTGIEIFKPLTTCTAFVQMMICFIEVIMIVWVYGRRRFQRDIHFMLGRTFSTWKFYIIRFITPIFILFIAFIYFVTTFLLLYSYPLGIVFTVIVKVSPWTIIPGYALYKLFVTTGSVKERFKKCIRPNDWYPADAGDRQRYDEALGSSEVSHQLVEMDGHE